MAENNVTQAPGAVYGKGVARKRSREGQRHSVASGSTKKAVIKTGLGAERTAAGRPARYDKRIVNGNRVESGLESTEEKPTGEESSFEFHSVSVEVYRGVSKEWAARLRYFLSCLIAVD